MPSATVGPVPLNDPPRAAILLMVENSRLVSKSQTISPFVMRYARRWPSIDPENTTPGTAVAGANWAGEHPLCPAQDGLGAGVFQTTLPVAASDRKSTRL